LGELEKRVGQRIKTLRKDKGLHAKEILGVAPTHLSRIENGHVSAQLETLGLIAEALKVEVADLIPKRLR
jgi:transcriptional regulator with XRE-family HTH domain